MRKKHKSKVNFFMCTAAVLLCATLFSMHLVGGLYAKYTTNINKSDGARVAAFKIEQSGTLTKDIKADVMPGKTQIADLTIKNDSEVAMEYTLKVTNVTGNITPLKFKLTPADDVTPIVTTESYEKGISINSARQIPGKHTDKYNLEIFWDENDSEENLAYIGMVDYVTVSVTAAQID